MVALLLLVIGVLQEPEEFTPTTHLRGKVVAVSDSGLIQVQRPRRLRTTDLTLVNVMLPRLDMKQPHAQESLDWMRKELVGASIVAGCSSLDGTFYARLLLDGEDFNLRVVESGNAWYYPRPTVSKELAKAQENAQADKLGIWAGDEPIEPWAVVKPFEEPAREIVEGAPGDVFASLCSIDRLLKIVDGILNQPEHAELRNSIHELVDKYAVGFDRSRRFVLAFDHERGLFAFVPITDAVAVISSLAELDDSIEVIEPGLYSTVNGGIKVVGAWLVVSDSLDDLKSTKFNPEDYLARAGGGDDLTIRIPMRDENVVKLNELLRSTRALTVVPDDYYMLVGFQFAQFVSGLLGHLDQIESVVGGLSIDLDRRGVKLHVDAIANPASDLAERLNALPIDRRLSSPMTAEGETLSLQLTTSVPGGREDPIRQYYHSNSAIVRGLLGNAFPDSAEERLDQFQSIIDAGGTADWIEAGVFWTGRRDEPGSLIFFVHSDDERAIRRATDRLVAYAGREKDHGSKVEEAHGEYEILGYLEAYEFNRGLKGKPKADFLIARRNGDCFIARGPEIKETLFSLIDTVGTPMSDNQLLTASIDLSELLADAGLGIPVAAEGPDRPKLKLLILPIEDGLRAQLEIERWLFPWLLQLFEEWGGMADEF